MRHLYIEKYIDESCNTLQLMYPDLPMQYIRSFVEKKAYAEVKDQQANIFNGYTHMSQQSTLLSILQYIQETSPIIAANASVYYPHDKNLAPATNMLLAWMKARKDQKKMAFKFRDEGNMSEYIRYNLMQSNTKVGLNSYYGAMGQKNSFGYNATSAAAITAQGRSIISTTMWFFEGFLGNNVFFEQPDELFHYIKSILSEENHLEHFEILNLDAIPDDNTLISYFMSKCEFSNDRRLVAAMLRMIIKHLTLNQKIKLFYKNNIYEFIERNPKVKEFLLENIIKTADSYTNPYEIPEGLVKPMEQFWDWIEEFVYLKSFITYNKVHRFEHHTRKIITYSDTDSVFIYMGEWLFKVMNWMTGIKQHEIKMNSIDTEFALKVINVLTNVLYIAIHKTYDTLTGNFGIEPEYRKVTNIKNEFLLSRYISFDMQKNYAYQTLVNEGNILKPPEFEVKGGNLNPKAKNQNVTKRLKNLVEHVLMDDDTIHPEKLLKGIYDFRDEIIASLEKGDTTYLPPIKIKGPDSYTNPYQQYTVRAIEAYRIATHDAQLSLPGTFYCIDVKGMERLDDLDWLQKNHINVYNNLKNEYFTHESLKKGGVKYIALPLRFEKIPDWIMPYIDISSIWRKHLNPVIALLPSVGVQQDIIRGKAYYSTVLRF